MPPSCLLGPGLGAVPWLNTMASCPAPTCMLPCCAYHAPWQAADLEKGARQLLDQLDDLSVDVPKAPLQVRSC